MAYGKKRKVNKLLKRKEANKSPLQNHQQGLMLINNGEYSAGAKLLEKAREYLMDNLELKLSLIEVYDNLINIYVKAESYSSFKKSYITLEKRLILSQDDIHSWLFISVLIYNKKYQESILFYIKHSAHFINPTIQNCDLLSRLIPYVFINFETLPTTFKRTQFYKESEYAYKLFNQALNRERLQEEAIKKISLLGPYRDLRIIIKSIVQLQLGSNPEKILLKIKNSSPLYELACVMYAAYEPSYFSFNLLQKISQSGLRLLKNLKGMDDKEFKLFIELLSNLNLQNSSDYISNTIINYNNALNDFSVGLLKGQLWKNNDVSISQVKKVTGNLTDIEDIKYNALWHEFQHNYCYEAMSYWEELVDYYAKSEEFKSKASFLSLHLAKYYTDSSDEKIKHYKNAVKHDASNIEAHKLLLDAYIVNYGIASLIVQKYLKSLINIFPRNIYFIELLITNIHECDNYEKSIELALEVLANNPANKICKDIAFKSTLSLLLKLIQKGEFYIELYCIKIEKYISEQEELIFKSLEFLCIMLSDNALALKNHPAIVVNKAKKPIQMIIDYFLKPHRSLENDSIIKQNNDETILDNKYGVLFFIIQGILLDLPLDKQISCVPKLSERLNIAITSLDSLRVALSYFKKEISNGNYGDMTPLILKTLKLKTHSFNSLLEFGFLLEDINFKKVLSSYSKYINGETLNEEAAIMYFDLLSLINTKGGTKEKDSITNNANKLSRIIESIENPNFNSRIEKLFKKLEENI